MTNKESSERRTILSIRLAADGFSFAAIPSGHHHTEENADIETSRYHTDPGIPLTANLKQALMTEEMLQREYTRVEIMLPEAKYTLVPLDTFEDGQERDIYYYNHPERPMEKVMYNILTRTNVVVVFAFDKSTLALIEERWPHARIKAGIANLMEHFALKTSKASAAERRIYVNIQKKEIHIIAFDHRRPILANTFECREKEDQAYHILNAWKGLGFDQQHDTLYLTGETGAAKELAGVLENFIKQVTVVNPAAEFNRSPLATLHEEITYDMLAAMMN